MASASTTSLAIVPFVLASMSCGLPVMYDDANIIARTCKKTTNALLCMAVLHVDPKSAYASTEHDLARVALQIASNTADYNAGVINNLSKGSQGTPEGGALAICLWADDDAASVLKNNARTGFEGEDYVGAMALVSGAKAVGDICENAFKMIGKKSPVSDINRQMMERCGVAGELIGLLIHK